MARPEKHTVKYFPHDVDHGLTIETLDAKHGIAGYYFWFRLLELLGKTKNHYIDIGNKHAFLMLQNYTKTNAAEATEILDLLAELDAIDCKLWESKIIYSQNFIDGIADVYKKRKNEVPKKPETELKYTETSLPGTETELTDTFIDQSKVNKSKVNKSKLNKELSCQLKVDVIDFESIIELYHEILTPPLPTIRILSDKLKKSMRTFTGSSIYKQISKQENLTTQQEFFRWYFNGIKQCSFLMGKTKADFKCNLHWVLNKNNADKIINGNYIDKEAGRAQNTLASLMEISKKIDEGEKDGKDFDVFS